jgi:hypothetical protein
VSKVLNIVQIAVNLYNTDVVKKKVESLPDVEKELAMETEKYLMEYLRGCKRMLQYDGGEEGAPAIEGLETVENALIGLDQIQDKAIEIYDKKRKEKEKEKEL